MCGGDGARDDGLKALCLQLSIGMGAEARTGGGSFSLAGGLRCEQVLVLVASLCSRSGLFFWALSRTCAVGLLRPLSTLVLLCASILIHTAKVALNIAGTDIGHWNIPRRAEAFWSFFQSLPGLAPRPICRSDCNHIRSRFYQYKLPPRCHHRYGLAR